jgi:peptidoglycan/LPS O-acetylase OafA/YrhL
VAVGALTTVRASRTGPLPAPPAERREATRRAAGLDGLRALAVLAVMAFHENFSAAPGGFLGVDVFFVLSGYLITDLLAAQFGRDGRLDMRGFYARRARRLLPALAVMLLTVTAAVSVLEPDQASKLRSALLGAVSYTSNWLQALGHQSYFDKFGPLPPLTHLWSLAVEEQFYLLWPLILLLVLVRVRRREMRAAIAWAGAAASALLMLLLYTPGSDPSLVYYGTDTHASGLLIGAALALTWPLARITALADRAVQQRLDVIGAAGLLVLALSVIFLGGADPIMYPLGLVLAALAAGGVVLAAASPGVLGRLLGRPPLRWLGVRSYGIYLWHWPVIAIAGTLASRHPDTAPIRLLETALPIALAAASWRWIEKPILRGGLRGAVRSWLAGLRQAVMTAPGLPARALALLTPLALGCLTVLAGYGLARSPSGPTLQQQIAAGAQVSAASETGQQPGSSQPGQVGQPGQDGRPGRGDGGQQVSPAVLAHHQVTALPRHVPGSMVTAVGDSVMLAAAPELHSALPGIYINAQVSRQMSAGLQLIGQLARQGALRPVVIVGLGTNGTVTADQIRQLRADLGPHRWLVLVNTFVPRPWQNGDNEVLASAASHDPRVLLVNWLAAIDHRTDLLWDDGVHPKPDGGQLYAQLVTAALQAATAMSRH